MEQKTIRKCYACGQIHEDDELCPRVLEHVRECLKSNKSACFWGNVFAQCAKKEKNFLQLLCEISELTKVLMTPKCTPNNIDLVLDYCTSFLRCDIKTLCKSQDNLSNFFYNLFKDNIFCMSESVCQIDHKNHTYLLSMECSVDNFFDEIPECMKQEWLPITELKELQLEIEKELKDNQIVYTLFIRLPKIIGTSCDRVLFMDIKNSSYALIKLCSDTNGKLKDLYEENSTFDYHELLEEISLTDAKFFYWKSKIIEGCNKRIFHWDKRKCEEIYTYRAVYDDWVFEYTRNKMNGFYELCVFKNNLGYKFTVGNDHNISKTKKRANKKAMREILEAIAKNYDIFLNSSVPKSPHKHINHKDVIITSNSLACKTHTVIPYKGIVHILTPDLQEKTYELYVSYCQECKIFRAFSADYEELLKHGKPLCRVYTSEKDFIKNKENPYPYKSHSVLNNMGYTVKANSGLSTTERRNILVKAIYNKLLTIDEVIGFLNWLADTRRGRLGYEVAVEKWTSDMLFLKELSKQRKSIKIDSIRL